MPKTLFYDIEVSPTLAWTYRLYDANVIKVERDQHILCFAYSWKGEDKIHSVSLPDYKSYYKRNPYCDKRVVKELVKLFNEADIVVAHNANKFDNRVLNERMFIHGLTPASPVRTIDTYAAAKRLFYHDNSLNALCRKLGIDGKLEETHSELWYDCIHGDMEAWDKMNAYCRNDVRMLEDLYNELYPYIPNLPTMADNITACPRCGSFDYQRRGHTTTNVAKYRKYQCNECGGWFSERTRDKEEPTTTFRSI